jgi:hypothetical protein
MSATVQPQLLTANFAKNLNLSNFKVANLSAAPAVPTPTASPVVASVNTQVPAVTPSVTASAPAPAPAAEPSSSMPVVQLQLDSIDQKLGKQSTQEQQYTLAGFVFKVPRVKSALIDATVDKNLQRTIDNIEAEQKKRGQGVIPLDKFSPEDQAVIALAQKEYNELMKSRNDDGVKQYENELKKWNNMKVLDSDGKETDQLVPVYTKILRDVFTLEFKSGADLTEVHGVIDSKDPTKNSGVRAWIKAHKKNDDRLSIRPRCQDQTHLVIEFTYNQVNPQVSDALVEEFKQWVVANAKNASIQYQRVTADYKKKMVKDKQTKKYTEQEKKKPTPPVADPLAGKDTYTSALYMVNRLRNRFSDEVSIAMTVFIDYLVQQFSYVAIVKCREEGKSRVLLRHVLDNTSQIELFPLISNFASYREEVLKHNSECKLNGNTVGAVPNGESAETTKKHEFEYCVSGVCKQLCNDLIKQDPTKGYHKILISSDFKLFMCKLVDEIINNFGPILRQAIESNDVKTVNINTFYNVLSVLLGWHRVRYDSKDERTGERQGIRPYIEDRVKRYVGFDYADAHHDGYIEVRAKERAQDRKKGKNPSASD